MRVQIDSKPPSSLARVACLDLVDSKEGRHRQRDYTTASCGAPTDRLCELTLAIEEERHLTLVIRYRQEKQQWAWGTKKPRPSKLSEHSRSGPLRPTTSGHHGELGVPATTRSYRKSLN